MSTHVRSPVRVSEIAQKVGYTNEAIRKWIAAGKISAAWDDKEKVYLVDPDEVRRVANSKKKNIPKPLAVAAEKAHIKNHTT